MTDGDGRVGVQKEQRHGLAHRFASAENYRPLSRKRYIFAFQKLHDPQRRTGRGAFFPQGELADIFRGKTVHIFFIGNFLQRGNAVQPLWKRQLKQNALHLFLPSEFFQKPFQLRLRNVGGQLVGIGTYPHFPAGLYLVSHVNAGGGVVADDHHRQTDLLSRSFDFFLELGAKLRGQSLSIDHLHGSETSAASFLITPARTPLTKSALVSVEYFLASPAASETETTGGISSK